MFLLLFLLLLLAVLSTDIKKPSVLSEDSDEEPEPDVKLQIPFNKVNEMHMNRTASDTARALHSRGG
jgi:hypothetical protein